MSANEKPLVIKMVVPHYLFSLFTSTDPDDPTTWIGAEVTMHHEPRGPYLCDFHGMENQHGEWLICLHDENGKMILRTHIEAVEQIVVP